MHSFSLIKKRLFLTIVILTSSAFAAGTRVVRDIPYATPANQRQMLDVYAPEGDGRNRPVIVWIHGGGWQRGDKSELAKGSNPDQQDVKPKAFVARGCIFVAMNYRFVPAVTLQEMSGVIQA